MEVINPKSIEEFMALPVMDAFNAVNVTAENLDQMRERYPDLPIRVGFTVNERVTGEFFPHGVDPDTILYVRTPEGLWAICGAGRRLLRGL